ncbi:DUF3267 domain-containing protein [Domibacillus sp. A3M-37]|uniref:DUF3267 domain-containing protein n=1 Tax=Domibacillus TaxID=1433999 RepID=UPI000617B259|nr:MULTISPECIES: DUF3267 domain-containing protein [Domibacillus]MCP3761600.1 DUF3267 domain-containing protein [Domibacillus sp. A3M-37]
MKCVRTYNFEKNYGYNKLFFVSMMTTMLVFLLAFSFMQSYYSKPLHANGFSWFAVGILAVYPLHKLIHLFPVLTYRPKVMWDRKYSVLPVVTVITRSPMPKKRFIVCLSLPFFVMTPLMLAGAMIMPEYLHYFTMTAAFHTGICLLDFLYIKALLSCPKDAIIEEDLDGFEVLLPE